MSNNDDEDFNSDDEEEINRIEEEQEREMEERERELEEQEQEMEREQRRIERETEERKHELEENEREREREHRRRSKQRQHTGHGPIPPIPPTPPIPSFDSFPHLRGLERMAHFMKFDEGRFEEEEFYRNRRRKNITIRGLKSDFYDDFSNKIQSLNFNIGIVFSKMMSAAFQKFNGEFPTINAKDILPPKKLLRLHINRMASINISKDDLEKAQAELTLDNIKIVKLEEDLTDEILKRYIDSINRCEKVLIPKSIPKLVALSLLNKCGSYEFY